MKTLLLLRHAKSAWSDPRLADHDRPLNARGERAAKAMADHFAQQAPRPDLILCSTALRTRQTLAPLLKRLGEPAPPVSLDRGHNDGIGDLARMLAGSGPAEDLANLREKYATGALATFRLPDGPWHTLAPGSAELTAFVRPRDLMVN